LASENARLKPQLAHLVSQTQTTLWGRTAAVSGHCGMARDGKPYNLKMVASGFKRQRFMAMAAPEHGDFQAQTTNGVIAHSNRGSQYCSHAYRATSVAGWHECQRELLFMPLGTQRLCGKLLWAPPVLQAIISFGFWYDCKGISDLLIN